LRFSSVRWSPLSAVGVPAAAGRDAPRFLDVHVDQFAGPAAFVADRCGPRPSGSTAHRISWWSDGVEEHPSGLAGVEQRPFAGGDGLADGEAVELVAVAVDVAGVAS
jgi:hypothetical protein